MIALKKILVATDFSEPSAAALDYGRELARSFGGSFTLLHIVDDLLVRADGVESAVLLADPTVQCQFEADARQQVDAAISDVDRAQLRATGVVLMSSSPSRAIVSYAQELDFDLIVMGTHGRGGLAHVLMGSVSERVVQTAPCPVLTVRHPEHEFVAPDASTLRKAARGESRNETLVAIARA
jgi:nucleotide-binding universal stress UspA family protein